MEVAAYVDQRELFERLTPIIDHKDDPVYRDADIRAAATHVINLDGRDLIAVLERQVAVSFVVFAFSQSNVDGSDTLYERVFHGNGFSGSLRELRHTFWGEADNAGYLLSERNVDRERLQAASALVRLRMTILSARDVTDEERAASTPIRSSVCSRSARGARETDGGRSGTRRRR